MLIHKFPCFYIEIKTNTGSLSLKPLKCTERENQVLLTALSSLESTHPPSQEAQSTLFAASSPECQRQASVNPVHYSSFCLCPPGTQAQDWRCFVLTITCLLPGTESGIVNLIF